MALLGNADLPLHPLLVPVRRFYLGVPAEWRVQDPVAEVRAAFAKQKASIANI